MKRVLGLALGLFLVAGTAQAGISISLVASGTWSKYLISGGTSGNTAKPVASFGAGTLVEFPLRSRAGIEVGILQQVRRVLDSSGVRQNYPYAEVPLSFRFWFNRVIVVGLGGYFAYASGRVTTTASGGASSSFSFPDSGTQYQDYGLLGSLGFNIPVRTWFSILAEGRYAYGLADINYPAIQGERTTWRDIQALAGLRFWFGGSR